jgi:hypothetical protein
MEQTVKVSLFASMLSLRDVVKSGSRTRRLPPAREKISSIANTGYALMAALTVLNTSFRNPRQKSPNIIYRGQSK